MVDGFSEESGSNSVGRGRSGEDFESKFQERVIVFILHEALLDSARRGTALFGFPSVE